MALQSPAYVISASSHGAELFRRAAQSGLMSTGVVGFNDLQVTQHSTPNMSVDVAAGSVWIPGTYGSSAGYGSNWGAQTGFGLPASFKSQGSYYAYNDATATLSIAAADPTNPRIDLVCVAVQDAQYSGVSNQALLQVVTGTPAPSPSAPAAPASSYVLATVLVPAAASSIVTSNITDQRSFAYSTPTVPLVYQATYSPVSNSTTTAPPGDIYGTVTVPNLPFPAMVYLYANIDFGCNTGVVQTAWFNGATRIGPRNFINAPSAQHVTGHPATFVLLLANSGTVTYTVNAWCMFMPGGYSTYNDPNYNQVWGWVIPTSGV